MVKTLVYQSYRTDQISPWLQTCMASVKRWAEAEGLEYRFVDDEILALVPDWFAAKASGRKQIITDLGRLLLARRYLAEGYGRVIWLDADVLVFDPDGFTLDVSGNFAFGREVWIQYDAEGRPRAFINIHNAVTLFETGNSFLDFYIDACLSVMERVDGGVPAQIIGPKFLKAIHNIVGFELLRTVGGLSPLVLDALLSSTELSIEQNEVLVLFRKECGASICAANLCASFTGIRVDGITVSEQMLDAACTRLLDTRGVALNGG